jgi:Subtilase family
VVVGRVIAVLAAAAVVVAVAAGSAPADPGPATPDDPAWSLEWGPQLTRTSDLWQLTTGNPGIVVAVVDTGLAPLADLGHIVPGWDFVGNDPDTSDTYGHGTWVSSILGATGNNGAGIAGYCWGCSIMPVRVSSGRDGALAPAIGAGIRYAVDHGARIVNVSLASNQYDWSEAGAVEYAIDHGVLVVASAGNGSDTGYRYPAAYPGVLSVAGTDEHDVLDDWSTRGPWVNLAAPGCEMVLGTNGGPASGCGSSFSPPAVAGIAGLLLSIDPGLTMYQLIGALRATAQPVDGIGGGRVDAWAAAHYLGLAPADPPPPAPPAAATPASAPPSPEVLVTTDIVRRKMTVPITVNAGRLTLQLIGPAAATCSLTLRAAGTLYVGLHAEHNIRSLAVSVAAGRYPVTIACSNAKPKPFELAATGLFPDD